MKFSIITPSYNQGKYIKNTLDSVLSLQSSCSVEHIVVDGGSKDETVSILKEYSQKYPNLVWNSCPDRGQSDAINKGLKLASGEIISYINSDDYYLPNVLNKVLYIFEKYPEVDFVYGDIFLINSKREILKRVKSCRTSLWLHLYSFSFPQQSCFWRRRLLEKVPEFNINNKTCMDSEYFAEVLSHQITLCRISEVLACFRIHEDSITGSQTLLNLYKKDKKKLEEKWLNYQYLPQPFLKLTGKMVKPILMVTRPSFEIFQS